MFAQTIRGDVAHKGVIPLKSVFSASSPVGWRLQSKSLPRRPLLEKLAPFHITAKSQPETAVSAAEFLLEGMTARVAIHGRCRVVLEGGGGELARGLRCMHVATRASRAPKSAALRQRRKTTQPRRQRVRPAHPRTRVRRQPQKPLPPRLQLTQLLDHSGNKPAETSPATYGKPAGRHLWRGKGVGDDASTGKQSRLDGCFTPSLVSSRRPWCHGSFVGDSPAKPGVILDWRTQACSLIQCFSTTTNATSVRLSLFP